MSDPVLHIKDSFFFEVPRALCPSNFSSRKDFPDVWVSLDSEFQDWEFHRLYHGLGDAKAFNDSKAVTLPAEGDAHHEWRHWQHEGHEHANAGKPFDVFLDEKYEGIVANYKVAADKVAAKIAAAKLAAANKKDSTEAKEAVAEQKPLTFDDFLKSEELAKDPYTSFYAFRHTADGVKKWEQIRSEAGDVKAYKADSKVKEWSPEKIEAYNFNLSGKILIPQPFGKLRNLHEADSGYCVSKFAIIQVFVALVMCVVFGWLGKRVVLGTAPKGRLWNMLETFVVFIRDQIAKPAIGEHDAHRFVPVLCTIFFFVLGCNLCGMLPWVGAPTGSFSVTLALAFVTFLTVFVAGVKQFGFLGFFKNQVPSMDLPLPIAIVLKPMIFAIEILGLMIKHLVLSIRLLANMVAGHLVLLGIMGVAFGLEAAFAFKPAPGWQWPVAAFISVMGCSMFSILELGVAFLQAYIFTFLSALFIGASVHHH